MISDHLLINTLLVQNQKKPSSTLIVPPAQSVYWYSGLLSLMVLFACKADKSSNQTILQLHGLVKDQRDSIDVLSRKLVALQDQIDDLKEEKNRGSMEENPEKHMLTEGYYVFDSDLELRSKNGEHLIMNPGEKLFLKTGAVFNVEALDFWNRKAIYWVSVKANKTNATRSSGPYVPNKIILQSDLNRGSVRQSSDQEINDFLYTR